MDFIYQDWTPEWGNIYSQQCKQILRDLMHINGGGCTGAGIHILKPLFMRGKP